MGLWGVKSFNGKPQQGTSLNPGKLGSWMDRIALLRKMFNELHFNHIYREKNGVADCLSNKGLQGVFGNMQYELTDLKGRKTTGSINFL